MTDGIKVAKSGYNVNSTQTDQFYIESDTPLLKIYQIIRGQYTFNPNLGISTFFIFHNLGYIPAFLLFMETKTGINRQLITSFSTANSGISTTNVNITATVDTGSIIVVLDGSGVSGNQILNYNAIIFYDEMFSEAGAV